MTATELEATETEPRKRPLVWPWAVLSALVTALLLPLAIFFFDLPREAEIPVTVACAVAGFAVPYLLAPHPVLRIRLLGIAVLVAGAWAAWAYRTNMHWWRPGLGDDHLLPWGVSNIPAEAVAAQPIAVGACLVLAVVALVRLGRGRIERTGWWTALLTVALLVCYGAALQTLLNRAYLA